MYLDESHKKSLGFFTNYMLPWKIFWTDLEDIIKYLFMYCFVDFHFQMIVVDLKEIWYYVQQIPAWNLLLTSETVLESKYYTTSYCTPQELLIARKTTFTILHFQLVVKFRIPCQVMLVLDNFQLFITSKNYFLPYIGFIFSFLFYSATPRSVLRNMPTQ